MSQPPGQVEYPPVDIRPEARPNEPPITGASLQLHRQVALYHRAIGSDGAAVQKLITLKTSRAAGVEQVNRCGPAGQNKIVDEAKAKSEKENQPWDWNEKNIGRYIASGITRPGKLALALEVTDEEISQIPAGEKHFPPDHPARTKDNLVYKGANERLLDTRAKFKERVIDEEGLPQALQPTLSPLSQEEIQLQTRAMSAAAAEIIAKRDSRR